MGHLILPTPGSARLLLLLACLTLAACGRGDAPRGRGEGPLRVVATCSIVGDLVRQIGGEHLDLTVLVGPDGDAHTYDPTARDSITVAEADVVFAVGLGFEPWLDGMVRASGSGAEVVTLTRTIRPRHPDQKEDSADEDHHGHNHGHHHGDGDADPHAWHDVRNAIAMVRVVAEALAAADADHAEAYAANRDLYIDQLGALDAYVVQRVSALPEDRRKLVTTHDAFGYFADRYGFTVISVMGAFSTASGDPSAAAMAAVIDEMRAADVQAVFVENILSPKLTERLAEQGDAQVVATLYSDSLGPAGSDGDTYLTMMRHNVDAIVGALQ